MRSVVRRVLNDGVVGESQIVDQLEQLAHMAIVLDHSIRVFIVSGMSVFLLHVGAEVHPRSVPPAEERLAGLVLSGDELLGSCEGFLIDRLHPLLGQRTSIDDRLAAFTSALQWRTPRGPKTSRNVLPLASFRSPG